MKIIAATNDEAQAAKEAGLASQLAKQEQAAGEAKIHQEEAREIARLSTRVDAATGQIRKVTLNDATLTKIHESTAANITAFDAKWTENEARRMDALFTERLHRLLRLVRQNPERLCGRIGHRYLTLQVGGRACRVDGPLLAEFDDLFDRLGEEFANRDALGHDDCEPVDPMRRTGPGLPGCFFQAGQPGVDALDRSVRLVDVDFDDQFELVVRGNARLGWIIHETAQW
jgi:hypothetical protein